MDLTGHYLFVETGAVLPKEKYPKSKFGFKRKVYMHPSETWKFANDYENTDVYQTTMMYIDPTWYQDSYGRWLINAEDSLKWGNFYLDFDNVIENEIDYDKVREDVMIAVRYLTLIMKIPTNMIQVYYSGSKGVHLMVPPEVFGLEPHLRLNEIYKEIMLDIKRYAPHDTIDVKIYDNKRLLRMVNSYNAKGERYKIPLTLEEMNEWSYEEVRQAAMQPRTMQYPPPVKSAQAERVLASKIDLWSKRAETQTKYDGKMKEIKDLPPCIKAMHDKTFRETVDERNNSASALASFYMQKGTDIGETREILNKWSQEQCKPPLKQQDLKIIVDSIYNGRYRYGCETLKRVSGVCDKDHCPLFMKSENQTKGAN